jgi:hypothetical protein
MSAGLQATVPAVQFEPDGFNTNTVPLQLTASSIINFILQQGIAPLINTEKRKGQRLFLFHVSILR